jgi:hypothetical protein
MISTVLPEPNKLCIWELFLDILTPMLYCLRQLIHSLMIRFHFLLYSFLLSEVSNYDLSDYYIHWLCSCFKKKMLFSSSPALFPFLKLLQILKAQF